MQYELGKGRAPDLVIRIDARHAIGFRSSIALAQRMLEITHGTRAALGVMCKGRDRLFGKMPMPGPSDGPVVESPLPLEQYGSGMTLAAQQAVVGEFRRVLGGSMRAAMSGVSGAFQDRPVYFVYYNHGLIALVPGDEGRWRLAVVRLDGARTMEDERACADVNRCSLSVHAVVWGAMDEVRRKEETAEAAIVEAPDQDEYERYDGYDDAGDDRMPDEPFAGRSLGDEEDEIDAVPLAPDAVRDAPDPTRDPRDDPDGPKARFDDDLDSVAF